MTWLVLSYRPLNLFSLKQSNASSKYGSSHIIPTPLVVKVAFVDAGFRKGGKTEAERIFDILKAVPIRIRPPKNIVVQAHTIKVLQPARDSALLGQTVVMREYCYIDEPIQVALEVEKKHVNTVRKFAPYVRSFGKKDSMVQFSKDYIIKEVGSDFSQQISENSTIESGTIFYMDDFSPEAVKMNDLFERVNYFSDKKLERSHRPRLPFLVPVQTTQQGSNFRLYQRE